MLSPMQSPARRLGLDCHCGQPLEHADEQASGCCFDCQMDEVAQLDYHDRKLADADAGACGKVGKGQCNNAGTTYCQFHCPYDCNA